METQISLPLPAPHGGKRRGAGRPPRTGRPPGVSHKRRPEVNARHPQHVVLKVVDGLPSLRTRVVVAEVEEAIAASQRDDFRVVHWSVQGTHVHLLVEVDTKAALSSGMHGLAIRCARRANRVFGRKGSLFADHYFARAVRTPTEMRNVLGYVVDNHEVHATRGGNPLRGDRLDPFSSLARKVLLAQPRSWLLRIGWTRAREKPGLRNVVRAAVWRLHELSAPAAGRYDRA